MTTARFEIRPLGLWDRPVTENRASSGRFRSTWDQTVDHLTGEVDHLGGTLVVVQIDADATDIRRDGMLRARARVGFPGAGHAHRRPGQPGVPGRRRRAPPRQGRQRRRVPARQQRPRCAGRRDPGRCPMTSRAGHPARLAEEAL